MKLLSLSVLMLLPLRKHVVEKYEGGSPYHSHLIITLFSDSTFTYSTWYHSSPKKTNTYKGVWHKTPGKLVLDSQKHSGVFHNESYVLKGDTLRLYTKEDSVKSYQFYKEYFTLARKP
jgi:hypothetical protein